MFQPSQDQWRCVRAHSVRNRTVNAAPGRRAARRPNYRKPVDTLKDAGPPSDDAGWHGNRHDATCVTSPRGSRDGLRHRNGKLCKLSRNATPEPPFSSAERATVDSTDYTSELDAVKSASQAKGCFWNRKHICQTLLNFILYLELDSQAYYNINTIVFNILFSLENS